MEWIKIDGSMGEGGGQVLRTALTLAMICQVNVEIVNIRANRNKPGLMRQHLSCVLAARTICAAMVEGAQLGSQHIRFCPGKIQGGNYHFSIATAGSTVLLCQTLLLALALCKQPSTLTFSGGTHNGLSPSLNFLQQAYLPLLARMGLKTELKVKQLGFYPAGGGEWSLTVFPVQKLSPLWFETLPSGVEEKIKVMALSSQLPLAIAQNEVQTVLKLLQHEKVTGLVQPVDSRGPGNILIVDYQRGEHVFVFELTGEKGLSGTLLANRVVERFKAFRAAGVDADEYLADQLLLPLALAGEGSFTTTRPSLHTTTNIAVIQLFGFSQLDLQADNDKHWRVRMLSRPSMVSGRS